MVYILIHGLGQDETSWNQVESLLLQKKMKVKKVSLYQLLQNQDFTYENLFESFVQYCLQFQEKVSLCGLSLGGILAMDFAKTYPQHIQSLIIIGTPYKIPRLLFGIQNLMFHLMPQSTFEKMGSKKKDFISLVQSMTHMNISKDLELIQCPTLLLCGEKDTHNKKGCQLLNEHIHGSCFEIIEHASHEVNIDNPQLLAQKISSFYTKQKA